MPAIRINTDDEALRDETFWAISYSGPMGVLPEHIYLVNEKQLESLLDQKLPIEVLNRDDVQAIVDKHRREREKRRACFKFPKKGVDTLDSGFRIQLHLAS